MNNNNEEQKLKTEIKEIKKNILRAVLAITAASVIGEVFVFNKQKNYKTNDQLKNVEITADMDLPSIQKEEILNDIKQKITKERPVAYEKEQLVLEPFDLTGFKGQTFIDLLNFLGFDSSEKGRAELAKMLGIENYKGTYEQNMKIMNAIKNGIVIEKPSKEMQNIYKNVVEKVKEDLKRKEEQQKNTAKEEQKKNESQNVNNINNNKVDISDTKPNKELEPEAETSAPNKKPETETSAPNKEPETETSAPIHKHDFNQLIRTDENEEIWGCVCGKEIAKNHNWDAGTIDNNGNTIYKCTNIKCGFTKIKEHFHKFIKLIQTTLEKETWSCVCGNVEERAHVWDKGTTDASGNTIYKCTNNGCGQTKEEKHEHNFVIFSYDDTTETLNCESCSETKTRDHVLGTTNVNSDGSTDTPCINDGCNFVKHESHVHQFKEEIRKVSTADHCRDIYNVCTEPDCNYEELVTEIHEHQLHITGGVVGQCLHCNYYEMLTSKNDLNKRQLLAATNKQILNYQKMWLRENRNNIVANKNIKGKARSRAIS